MDLNQVTVQSTDITQSINFYRLLGLTLIVQDEHYARFELPNGNATFSVHYTEEAKISNTIIYFEVNDVVQTVENLKSKGIEFIKEPTQEQWLWHEARLVDPSGNELCIYTAGENRKNPPWRI
ncbi:hypothetical protein R50073_44290 [Maricurvus nonylphenolicus]|uniref:VOC family protein n=1 Tax=Maricurvus nonylphenolicus TaxID=1008307 RepID=UPI0036F1B06B